MLPLEPRDTRALFEEFRRVGRSALLGTVLTGMAQVVLAGMGFYLTKVPAAAFLWALTAIASLMPGAGPLLVWPVLMTLALAVLRSSEREATRRRESEVAAALAQIQSPL